MALTGVVEFALHLDNFKNIDLFHQGLYHVQFKIYHMQKENVNFHFQSSHPRKFTLFPTNIKTKQSRKERISSQSSSQIL